MIMAAIMAAIMAHHQEQKRTHARVEDLLPLSWRRIDAREQAEVVAFFSKNGLFPSRRGGDVRQLLAALDIRDHLTRLEQESPELAFILGRLDVKLNLLLQLAHPSQGERPFLPTRVNLSGGGIAFWGDHPGLVVGDFLELRLALAVGALAIVDCFVRVVEISTPDNTELAKIACMFDPVSDDVREQIIQHVFKRQTAMLRAKKHGVRHTDG